jgi:lipopolysaccharide export system permease protein
MTIIDRYLLRQFMQNFIVCFVSLTGVYVVFDAFSNLEAFLQYAKGVELLKAMAAYYGYQSLFFFDRISPLLVLMSAMFTMAWIQRHHELTALMAAGISRIRVAKPVLAAAAAVTLLAVVNREMVIPKIKDQLAKRPSGLKGNVIEELDPQYDEATNVLICGHNLVLDQKKIEQPEFVLLHTKEALRSYGKAWTAAVAQFLPATESHPAGYLLEDVIEPKSLTQRPSLMQDGRPIFMTPHDYSSWLKPNQAFMVSDVTIDELTPEMKMRWFASTGELIWSLKHRSLYFSPDVRVMIHSRILQPFLDLTLLFLGLPLVVARDNRNVFVAIGMCIGLVALFFLVSIACQQLGANMLISPALAAWAPLMIFVPAAVGMSAAMWER